MYGERVDAALTAIDEPTGSAQVRAGTQAPAAGAGLGQTPPDRVVLFTGHMVDARDRDPDPAVILPAGPVGRPRDVAKLFLGVQHGDNGVRRILAERVADSRALHQRIAAR